MDWCVCAGLACRTLDPTKILVVGKSRLLINCSGIFDVLTYDPNSSNPMATMAVYQQVIGRDKCWIRIMDQISIKTPYPKFRL